MTARHTDSDDSDAKEVSRCFELSIRAIGTMQSRLRTWGTAQKLPLYSFAVSDKTWHMTRHWQVASRTSTELDKHSNYITKAFDRVDKPARLGETSLDLGLVAVCSEQCRGGRLRHGYRCRHCRQASKHRKWLQVMSVQSQLAVITPDASTRGSTLRRHTIGT